jgi:ABC-type transporter Mla MlaB component
MSIGATRMAGRALWRPPSASLEISVRRGGYHRSLRVEALPAPAAGVALLRLHGVLDRHAVRPAREAMGSALAGRPRLVVLQLAGLTRLDGPGLALLMAMHRHARRAGARLSIVDSTGCTSARAGPASTLPVYQSLAAALAG